MSPILGIWASQNYPRVTNSYESIETVTVGSTSVANVTFSSIPSTYKHLQVRYMVKSARNDGNPLEELNLRMNGDTGNNYVEHQLTSDGSGVGSNGLTSQNNIELGEGWMGDIVSGSQFGVGVLDILDYASTNKTKVIRVIGGVDFNGAPSGYGGRVGLASGFWNNTSAITSLTFYAQNGNLVQYSQIALYGIKG